VIQAEVSSEEAAAERTKVAQPVEMAVIVSSLSFHDLRSRRVFQK
jgi:hypothetical protein